ncbi:MAG: hypothetical protein HY885_12730 [Deltaproteobacteria bacterium]|nr:hypothetical protein [Deltaproteobacteria bacterium]
MIPLTALYFPDTSVSARQVSQELLFFDKIYHYLPSETDGSSDSVAVAGICEGYPPVPFADELNRFRQLIRELKGNEAEFYSGHLSSIAASHSKNREELSVRSLINTIGGKPLADKAGAEADTREGLWQARLLLKLAEILYQEEQELQQELSAIAVKERELFESLKGEPEIPFALSGFAVESRPPVRPAILLKAWAKLFLADTRQGKHAILVSNQEQAAEALFEANEALSGQRPVRLFRIPLPDSEAMDMAAYINDRAAFRASARDIIAGFKSAISATLASGVTQDSLKSFTILAAEWTKNFHTRKAWETASGPSGQLVKCQGEPHLEVYLCNRSLPSLMAHLCRAAAESAVTPGSPAIIALKSSKKSTCKG